MKWLITLFCTGTKQALKEALQCKNYLRSVLDFNEDVDVEQSARIVDSAEKCFFALYGKEDFPETVDEL